MITFHHLWVGHAVCQHCPRFQGYKFEKSPALPSKDHKVYCKESPSMLHECCRQHRLRDFRRQGSPRDGTTGGDECDIEKSNSVLGILCSEFNGCLQKCKFPITNSIPSSNGIAVLMTVFLRNYKGELQCTESMYWMDVLKVSFLLPHLIFSVLPSLSSV